ncbi:MAG: (2Fe-2S)-binding protein, partial [Gemmatimonadetes bacterium]|nr:(2Fe-2S)-binding protein [Gemmatimonadota bacterium]
MPTVEIDGRQLEAADGTTILEAARAAGIEIPTLCWYPKLPVVGNCRICVVAVEGSPKLLPACATQTADGMQVWSQNAEVTTARRSVLSLLLERYPAAHLANGGRAHPQNEFERYVVAYGVDPNPSPVRALPLREGDERPGDPMISHDMSRCILCTRCVRACEDIQVVGVLDVGYRGEHAQIVVGADGDPDKAACTWCGECVRVCPTGAIFEVMPRERFGPVLPAADRVVRSVCPYCGVGCQLDLQMRGQEVVRVTSPTFEENTPNQGSTCVKGRFGYDFIQHRDRLTTPFIRKGWVRRNGRWAWEGAVGRDRRAGPWREMVEEGETDKPQAPPRAQGKRLKDLSLLERVTQDIRDRATTPPDWYQPFRPATWD